MTVGYFAPLPPARTGVADYARSLLDALRKRGVVEVHARRADVNLYHIGNNQMHREIYRRAIEQPGVAVLHDAVLHHFFLGAVDREEYIREFVHNYGEWSRDTAASLWAGRARSAADAEYFRYPMLKRIAQKSRAIVVHNAAAGEMVRRHAPEALIVEIPHLFAGAPTVDGVAIEELRRSLGIRQDTVLLGVFGHLRESKRIAAILRVFQKLECAVPNTALLLAGECVSSDLSLAIEPFQGHGRIIRRGFLGEDEFWKYAHATDICINLRYPSAGEASGIGVRFMGIGKPVILTQGPEIAGIPADACLRVCTGIQEEPMLMEYVIWTANFPHDAREIGRRAAAHIAAHHNIDMVADRFWSVLRGVA